MLGQLAPQPGMRPLSLGIDPFNLKANMKYHLDFVADTYKGGFMNYTNNNDDGRLFRSFSNFTASFVENADGSLTATAANNLRRSNKGLWVDPDRVNVLLWNRDLTNAVWTKSNVTAAKNQTGVNNSANAASSITAAADGGTILQSATATSGNRFQTAYVKRLAGAGTLEITMDGGTTWTVVPVTAGWKRLSIPTQVLSNPTVGFRIGTSGDSFAIDLVQNESGLYQSSPIATTSATVQHWKDRAASFTGKGNGLPETLQGPFAFFAEYQAYAKPGGDRGIIVSDNNGHVFIDHDTNVVTFEGCSVTGSENQGTGDTLSAINRIVGYRAADGSAALCVNGSAISKATGRSQGPSLTHFDLGTNGAGLYNLGGVIRTFAVAPCPVPLADAQLLAWTAG